ncbi:MAG: MGMT family protein [Lactobacillaceae bacterium]|jgi:methylated-DNA-protein-cysteine methyltransferase-like protein|nr:MGMT family protein [Lactobacillaceae bacterium]
MKTFNQKVYDIVKRIPLGMVMNYGQIARLAGNSMASRAVGYALHNLPDPETTPWHRVVFKDGSLPKLWHEMQYKLLKDEKVSFTRDRKVKMEKHGWDAFEIEMENF